MNSGKIDNPAEIWLQRSLTAVDVPVQLLY